MHNPDELLTWLELNLEVRQVLTNGEVNCICPFHQTTSSTKPDLWVNVEKAVFNCLSSSCGAKGSAQKLVVAVEGCSPEEAQRVLGRTSPEGLQKMLEQLQLFDKDPRSLDWPTINSYKRYHVWWQMRGIFPSVQDVFDLGYDVEQDAATIPYLDQDGQPHSMIRRFREPRAGMKYSYPVGFSREHAVFNLHRAVVGLPTVVVEGSIDCIKCAQNILNANLNVVALLGSHISDEQIERLRHLDLILMLDPDPAGKAGTEEIHKRFPRICKEVQWKNANQDPGSLNEDEFFDLIEGAR